LPPQLSLTVPHVFVPQAAACVTVVQAAVQLLSMHVLPAAHVPQSSALPHPSSIVPHEAPAARHVVAVQVQLVAWNGAVPVTPRGESVPPELNPALPSFPVPGFTDENWTTPEPPHVVHDPATHVCVP
jgi:hypothetical protein